MDLKEEFYEARDWIRDYLTCEKARDVSVFETTIRSLGGLLSAYDVSGDAVFLSKAKDLGSRLIVAFDGSDKNGMPHQTVNLSAKAITRSHRAQTNIAEVGTLQLEFRQLSSITNDPSYAQKTERVFELLHPLHKNGLYPIDITKKFQSSDTDTNLESYKLSGKITFGAMGDSFYEYMLKMWLQSNKTETKYRDMYDESMDGLHAKLIKNSSPDGLSYISELTPRPKGSYESLDKMDHLACFTGGLLALGAYTDPLGLESKRAQRDLKVAKALTYTCYQMYARMPLGIAPESVTFTEKTDKDFIPHIKYYILRPETVESLYILHTLTGDPVYREWGWEIFQAIDYHCKRTVGFASLKDVTDNSNTDAKDRFDDKMESFFLSETLKYLYLLFDPDSDIDILNKHVFNTEAHPFKIFPR